MKKVVKSSEVARSLLEGYGADSLSYFSLHKEKKLFFSSSAQSFLAYLIIGKIILVCGDPIGAYEDIPTLLQEFGYFSKGARLKSCFIGITKETLPLLAQGGHRILHIGNEAVIMLENFEKSTLKKKVRRAENHIQNLGITCKIYTRQNVPTNYFKQLNQVSTQWLAYKGGKERGHTMTLGRLPRHQDSDCVLILALKGDKVLGYLTFVPIYAANGFSLDASRKIQNSPNGLTEFLLLQALEYFQKQGIANISLNFATFYHTKINFHSPNLLLKTVIYKGLSHWYKTHNLYEFNNKFLPEWKERYVAFEKKRYLPKYIFAIAKAEL